MPTWLTFAVLGVNGVAALVWVCILAHPVQAWRMRPIAEEATQSRDPDSWPRVCIIVPAHNEETVIAETLETLLAQDYPGEWQLVVVDERSSDGTAARVLGAQEAHAHGTRVELVRGARLPEGWVGKVWGLQQGVEACADSEPEYLLLTDADITHAPDSLRRLVAESEAEELALNSRMARLHCSSWAERLMIPAFVFFFNLLYPMPQINDPTSRVAAAAGGCVLLRTQALVAIGGFTRIRNEVIDDVNLARAVREFSPRLRLALSVSDVRSRRRYSSLGPIWRMVRRTAFDELGYSWLRLGATVVGMIVLFALAPASLGLAAGLTVAKAAGHTGADSWQLAAIGGLALSTMFATRIAYGPAVSLFGLRSQWSWALSLAGTIYGLVTLDSARLHLGGRGREW